MRNQRKSLAHHQQRQAGLSLANTLTSNRLFLCSRRIACYLPADGEIETFAIIEQIWRLQKSCYLPVVSHLSWDHLWFAPLVPETEFVVNRYGIPEPDVERKYWVRAQTLGLILMPLVAFDVSGNRIGMGAGFYDRSLAFLQRRQHWKRPHTIGLAHDFQQVDNIAPEAWDIPLQGIATDKQYYPVNR